MAFELPKTPYLSVDGIVEMDEKHIIIIERKYPPLGFAIPGGFVDYGESTENAIMREMREELSIRTGVRRLLGVYSNPDRDKRGHIVTVAYVLYALEKNPKAADDAKSVHIMDHSSAMDLNFEGRLVADHGKILMDYIGMKHDEWGWNA